MFKFKQFNIQQERSSMKVNTDGILLGAWAQVKDQHSILDIGCGNGLIALMLAQRNSNAKIDAVEIAEGSFLDAKENVAHSIFKDRIEVFHQSIQQFSQIRDKKYDHIVSNPPFFTGGTFSMNENKMHVRHTIKLSHQELIHSVRKMISLEGVFSVILPLIEGLRFIELAQRANFKLIRKCEVHSRQETNIERLLLSFGRGSNDGYTTEKLIIHDGKSNSYSEDYIALTKAFYLYM